MKNEKNDYYPTSSTESQYSLNEPFFSTEILKNGKIKNADNDTVQSSLTYDRCMNMKIEMDAVKAELKRMKSENEEKDEQIIVLEEEIDKLKNEVERFMREKFDVIKDVRETRRLKDEIECMEQKLSKLERLEVENKKLRSKLTDMDFYKTRMKSLKEDAQIMQETNQLLEDQLKQCQSKLEEIQEMESKFKDTQEDLLTHQRELSQIRKEMENVLNENYKLELDAKISAQKYIELERKVQAINEFSSPRDDGLGDISLLSQLEEVSRSEILDLKLENRKLKAQLDRSLNPADVFEQNERNASNRLLEGADTQHNLNVRTEEHDNLKTELFETRKRMSKLQFEECKLNEANKNLENTVQKLAIAENHLVEKDKRIEILESDLSQTELDKKKTKMLLEEQSFRLSSLLDRLRNITSIIHLQYFTFNIGGGLQLEELEDDEYLLRRIDQLLIEALNAAKKEADLLRSQQKQQIQELDDLKAMIHDLRKNESELKHSSERDDEICIENKNIKEQVIMLQNKLKHLQNEENIRLAELKAAKCEIRELQHKVVVLSHQSAELSSFKEKFQYQSKRENDLLSQVDNLLKSNLVIEKRFDSLEVIHRALAADHDRLQSLHKMLMADYDRIKRENRNLKQQKVIKNYSTLESTGQQNFKRSESMRYPPTSTNKSLREINERIRQPFHSSNSPTNKYSEKATQASFFCERPPPPPYPLVKNKSLSEGPVSRMGLPDSDSSLSLLSNRPINSSEFVTISTRNFSPQYLSGLKPIESSTPKENQSQKSVSNPKRAQSDFADSSAENLLIVDNTTYRFKAQNDPCQCQISQDTTNSLKEGDVRTVSDLNRERDRKAMSIYENVDNQSPFQLKNHFDSLFMEMDYGCV